MQHVHIIHVPPPHTPLSSAGRRRQPRADSPAARPYVSIQQPPIPTEETLQKLFSLISTNTVIWSLIEFLNNSL